MVTSNGKPSLARRLFNRFIPAREDAPPPKPNEKTAAQRIATAGMGFGQVSLGLRTQRFLTYRRIIKNPSVALARMVTRAPLKSAEWTYEKTNDDVPDEWVELVQKTMDPLRRGLMHDMFFGVDFGFAPFEKVWKVDDTNGGRLVYDRIKPLMVDITRIMIDKESGAYEGLKNKDALLDERHSFLFTNDPMFGDLHGQPRTENIWAEWQKWHDACAELGKYLRLSANPRPVVGYSPGTSEDADGSTEDNFDLAQKFLQDLSSGLGVAFPMEFAPWAESFLNAGVDPSKLMAWQIQFLETKSSRVEDFLKPMRHWERLMFRGYLVPERTATEGETGTKAEAATQGDVAMEGAEELKGDMMECINLGLIDDLLIVNFGREAKGKVRAKAAPLTDEQRAFFILMIEKLLSSPIGPDIFLQAIDEIALFEQAGLPIAADRQAGDAAGLVDEGERQRLQQMVDGAPVPAVPEPGAAPVADVGVVDVPALNGAQITAAMRVIEQLNANQLTVEQGMALLQAMAIPEDQARAIVGTARASQ